MQQQIQLYEGVKDVTGVTITVEAALQTITGPSLKPYNLTKIYNEYLAAANDDERKAYKLKYDAAKSKLPAVTWSGNFTKRNAKNLIQHSGLICLDIDKITADQLKVLRAKISADLHTFALFISPSGHGLKVLVKIEASAENHKHNFKALATYYKNNFDIDIDESGKDVSRLCFLAHNATIYTNNKAVTFVPALQTEIPQPEAIKQTKLTKQQQTDLYSAGNDLYSVIDFTDRIKTYTDGNHNNYIHLFACNANRLGFSLNETLGFSINHFNNKPSHEVEATVKSAFANNSHEAGKFAKTNKSNASKNSTGNSNSSSTRSHNTSSNTNGQTSGNDGGKQTSGTKSEIKKFWKLHKFTKGKGEDAYEVERLELNRVDFSDFLFSQGFHLLKTGKNGYQICQSANGVIKPVEPQEIKQYVLQWCKAQGLRDVEEMLRKGQKNYFAFNELDSLPYKQVEFQKDTATESYFYFRNCWVTVTKEGITVNDYKDLKKFIWEGNKIDADFTLQYSPFFNDVEHVDVSSMQCEFAKFLAYFSYNPKSPDELDFTPVQKFDRFMSVATSYGFLLDGYKHPAIRKGIFAVDHKIGDKGEQHGRTGKSIIPKAASYLKVVSTINGKSFNPQYQFKYEPITMDTQIVNFNDMPRNFDVETIFEVIADDYSITRRNNGYINFLYADSPKPYISTNFTPKGEGASYTGRMHIIEACDYFNDTHSPYDEFGHALFTDWSAEQWNLFYNTSLQCVQAYKELGLVPYPAGNFEIRKLVNDVVPEFIDFMDSTEVVRNEKIAKITLFDKFNNDVYNSLYGQKLKPHTFHKWVKQYCKNKGLRFNPHKGGGHDKSNGKEYYIIADKNYIDQQTTLL